MTRCKISLMESQAAIEYHWSSLEETISLARPPPSSLPAHLARYRTGLEYRNRTLGRRLLALPASSLEQTTLPLSRVCLLYSKVVDKVEGMISGAMGPTRGTPQHPTAPHRSTPTILNRTWTWILTRRYLVEEDEESVSE